MLRERRMMNKDLKITKKYKKPTVSVLGQVKTQTQGSGNTTCDGSGSLGSGSNSNANACKS